MLNASKVALSVILGVLLVQLALAAPSKNNMGPRQMLDEYGYGRNDVPAVNAYMPEKYMQKRMFSNYMDNDGGRLEWNFNRL